MNNDEKGDNYHSFFNIKGNFKFLNNHNFFYKYLNFLFKKQYLIKLTPLTCKVNLLI